MGERVRVRVRGLLWQTLWELRGRIGTVGGSSGFLQSRSPIKVAIYEK
jgi:hypothetical protein